jgi:ribosome-associated protein
MSKSTEKQLLIDKIVEAIQDTRRRYQIFDLSGIENSVADTFVICSGNSNTQVSAIAGNIEKKSETISKKDRGM